MPAFATATTIPEGFDPETFGNSLTLLMEKLHGPEAAQAAPQ